MVEFRKNVVKVIMCDHVYVNPLYFPCTASIAF